jgi:molybdenum-dependent DNA-binding transcriptional regulator ModE
MNEKSTMAINRDYADLDGRLLKLLLAVVETGSITGAALQLVVTQSAVSHLLDKLRAITGDPLFVKSGARHCGDSARPAAGGARARTAGGHGALCAVGRL